MINLSHTIMKSSLEVNALHKKKSLSCLETSNWQCSNISF